MTTDNFKKFFRKYNKVILLLFFSWFFVVVSYQFGFFSLWQSKIFDSFFTKKTPPSNIVIVSVDDETLTELGGWPIPRSALAKVLYKIQSAKSVGFDISLSDISSKGEGDDYFFEQALRNNKTEIFLASQFDDREGKIIMPLERFAKFSKSAFVNVLQSQDGTVRTFHPKINDSLALSYSLLGLQTNFSKTVTIDYYGPQKTFTYIPFIDVYNGNIPSSVFKNKIVLIGATAPDLHDILASPFGAMPGVEIHANALATLQTGKFFKPLNIVYFALLVLFFNVLSILMIVRLKRIWVMIVALFSIFVLIQLVSIVFFTFYIEIPNLYISLSFLIISGFLILYQYFSESKEKKMIREMFQYYLMPEVIQELVSNPEKLRLGGEKRKMTILFSDIRDFTTISEKLSPEVLTSLLNEYLTDMTNAVMNQRGFVDKYIGDAVMAFWGAPIQNESQAQDACLSALSMSEELAKLNPFWSERGLPKLSIGIGINTGQMTVGNIGSTTRFNYTVIGDEVNFASRLEGLNKMYGTECIISESTKKEIEKDNRFITRELDLVTVKGKSEPKLIFELITKPIDSQMEKILKEFSLGRELYSKGDFEIASLHFTKAISYGVDRPSSVFLDRCLYLIQNPPKVWSGVYEFKTK